MNSLIQQWLDAEVKAEEAQGRADDALAKANKAEPPKSLRPATARDITQDAIIWYPKYFDPEDDLGCWKRVEEVLRPADQWKAYTAHDGCRYGLEDAFVETD